MKLDHIERRYLFEAHRKLIAEELKLIEEENAKNNNNTSHQQEAETRNAPQSGTQRAIQSLLSNNQS